MHYSDFSAINDYVSECISLSSADLAWFNEQLSFRKIPKKSFLLQPGEVCKFEAFVLKGCIKTYCIDAQGQEVILTFATEHWWVSDIGSFHEQTPSELFIETMEPSELYIISPAAKAAILERIPAMERMFRLMVQKHLVSSQTRLLGNISLTAEERYNQFLEKYPHLLQRIPQHQIAAFIGISPEFLSRIRNKKAP